MSMTVIFTTPAPAAADKFQVRVYLVRATADDDTVAKRIRFECTSEVAGDDGSIRKVTKTMRASATALPHDGAADGSSAETPAPLSTLTGTQVTTFLSLLRDGVYAKWRALANND